MTRSSLLRFARRQALDAALGIAVTAALLAAGELCMLALGVVTDDPLELSRGFDPAVDYVVPDPEVPGAWRTRIGASAIDSRSIGPKDGRVRVLLFGGSNVRAFRETYLENELNRARAGTRFQVLNLGRSGYGTGRVAILFEQALERLDPDVAVIYAGHNEFVERSFRLEVHAAWGMGWERRLGELAQHSRLASWMRDLVRRRQDRGAGRQTQASAWRHEYAKFDSLTYAETLEEYERYRENLERMCRVASERGVRLVLSTVVHNRFSPPFTSTPDAALTRKQVADLNDHLLRAREGLPEWLCTLLPERIQDRVTMRDWKRNRDAVVPQLPGLRPLAGPLAGRELEWRAGDWSQAVLDHYGALERLHAGGSEEEREALRTAALELRAALAIDPENPLALFELALVEWALGERGELVRGRLEDAARYDRAPRKATGLVNEHVRSVASDFPGVVRVELDEYFGAAYEDGVVGWEVMTDHCHLSPFGAKVALEVLGRAILDAWYPEGD